MFLPSVDIFSRRIPIPGTREGIIRLGLGFLNWGVVSILLAAIFSWYRAAPFELVVMSYLAAAVAGLISHIPAGLGVFEATFLATIGPVIGDADVVAGVIFFRMIYYVLPLALALAATIWLKAAPAESRHNA
jgi:uncharacterized membrane protein YbhN (UPF0104 family)